VVLCTAAAPPPQFINFHPSLPILRGGCNAIKLHSRDEFDILSGTGYHHLMLIRRVIGFLFWLCAVTMLLGRSNTVPGDQRERARAYTRNIEFNYVSWELDALWTKFSQWALGTSTYLPDQARKQTVLDYLKLIGQIQQAQAQLYEFYADPNISDPKTASADLRLELDRLKANREKLEPLAESILQSQVSIVVSELGLTLEGEPIPPVLYRITPLPDSLAVSRRDKIEFMFDISIQPGLSVDRQAALEEEVDQALDVSTLVVGIGGVGLYPPMIMESTDLNWLSNTISHEWTHNFLTLRPLGVNYATTPELRTINETVASIAGNEIGQEVISRYYPELQPPTPEPTLPPDKNTPTPEPTSTPEPPAFNFNREMHETRVIADQLLADGKIEEAEAYMEARRIYIWENGYHIRKLNQAYFAFYGAYADVPGGAAGEDPVGTAVRSLRTHSATLADFLNRISWMTTYQQLIEAVNSNK
jgi:hypothetical protein